MRFFVFLVLISSHLLAAPQIVLTFDNLPLEKTKLFNAKERTELFLEALSKEGVRTVFFAIGTTLARASPKKMECVEQIAAHGHRIANHSFSHPFLSTKEVAVYMEDVRLCEAYISQFATYAPWFRYPYLDVGLDPLPGASIEKARECAQKLQERGFLNGYVTLDSFDWFIESLLQKALDSGKKIDRRALETFYVHHLEQTIQRYLDTKSELEKSLFETHVILFHANDLNALCLPAVIKMLRTSGWHIVDPEEAFQPKNALSEFRAFIDFKVKQLTHDPHPIHSSERTTREFKGQVLHEP